VPASRAVTAAASRSMAAWVALAVLTQIESAVPGPPSRRSGTGSGEVDGVVAVGGDGVDPDDPDLVAAAAPSQCMQA
jgi:hypothetical protein